MAALMTCVIDFPDKCAEYILHCHEMNIEILPPSINKSIGSFSVEDGKIRYGLNAIKSVGRSVIKMIVDERNAHGEYKDLKDFLERTFGRELNKRAIENMIKAGAFDGLGGNRRQYLMAFSLMLDDISKEKKSSITGQMTLFDFMQPEEKEAYSTTLPDVPELLKEDLLMFEKEVLGIYLSGHPLEEDEKFWRSVVTAYTTDFAVPEENTISRLNGGERKIIGGMISSKTIKYTRNNKAMAFLSIEDLVGTAEVIVFPKVYEQFSAIMTEDAKVFVEGRVSLEEEKASKLICDRIWRFEDMPKQVWIQFKSKQEYDAVSKELENKEFWDIPFGESAENVRAKDRAVIYIRDNRSMKRLNFMISVTKKLTEKLEHKFGPENVRVTKL